MAKDVDDRSIRFIPGNENIEDTLFVPGNENFEDTLFVPGNENFEDTLFVPGNENFVGNENTEGNDNTEGNENIEDNENTPSKVIIEGSESTKGNENIEGNQNTEGNEDTEGYENIAGNENLEGNGDTEGKVINDKVEGSTDKKGSDIDSKANKKKPINILVIGPTFSGKTTLINAMFGEDVVTVSVSAESQTRKVEAYEGEYNGVKIKLYDTVGFGDTKGKTGRSIIFEIAEHGQFDLILICTKLVERVDRGMFEELASVLHTDMWKRTVVVLTFANQFETLRSVTESKKELKVQMKMQVNSCKGCVVEFLSKSINKEVLDKIPFCVAGVKDEKKLPTTDNWLKALWATSIKHSSDEARPFLTFCARNRGIIETGSFIGSVGAGAGIGAGIGTFIAPGAGTAIGAGIGAGVAAGASLVGILVGRIVK